MTTEARLLIEMVDPSGNVLWSERPVVASEGYEIRFGPVLVDYTVSPESSPGVQIKGKFSGYLKVTVLDVQE
jgi:hypothetical protein